MGEEVIELMFWTRRVLERHPVKKVYEIVENTIYEKAKEDVKKWEKEWKEMRKG